MDTNVAGFCEKIEFGHSIIAENMCRMHKCAKLKGYSVCDYYTVSQKSETSF